MATVDLSNEEIAKLICSIDDDTRKEQLKNMIDGQETVDVTVKNVTIMNSERGTAFISICHCKSGEMISCTEKVISFTPDNITALFNLIKTFDPMTSQAS